MSETRIQQLAREISHNTTLVNEYLLNKRLPQPSFEVGGPFNALANVPSEIQLARDTVVEASIELQQLLSGNFDLLAPTVSS
jgi:hypothetical protein